MSDSVPTSTFNVRRRMLQLGLGSAATVMTGSITQGQVTATPIETQGPFWIDPKLLRSNIRESQAGLPLYITVNVSKLVGGVASPLQNAYVDLWHCNAAGAYSGVSGSGNPNTIGQTWLRGYQITNARGVSKFITIYPGWYVSRTVHIHARVRTFSGATTTLNMTTQFFFDDTVSDQVFSTFAPYTSHTGRGTRNANDSVYNTVSSGSTVSNPDGSRLKLRMSQTGTIATASFNIVVV